MRPRGNDWRVGKVHQVTPSKKEKKKTCSVIVIRLLWCPSRSLWFIQQGLWRRKGHKGTYRCAKPCERHPCVALTAWGIHHWRSLSRMRRLWDSRTSSTYESVVILYVKTDATFTEIGLLCIEKGIVIYLRVLRYKLTRLWVDGWIELSCANHKLCESSKQIGVTQQRFESPADTISSVKLPIILPEWPAPTH